MLQMELAGANTMSNFTVSEQLPGKSNYFIGNKPENWRTNVPQYRKIMQRDVYHGVNLVYYGTQGQLEYDFDVAAGVNPSVIHLAFKGARDLHTNAQGELVADTMAARGGRWAPHRVSPSRFHALRRTYSRAADLHALVSGAAQGSTLDLLSGKLDGIVFRVTLDQSGHPARLRLDSPLRLLPHVLSDAAGKANTRTGFAARSGFDRSR